MDIQALEAAQKAMAAEVTVFRDEQIIALAEQDIIFTVDIQYVGDRAFVAVDIRRMNGEGLGIHGGESIAGMQYLPRFFCFREGPPVVDVLQQVMAQTGYRPALIIIDGHGIAHPLRLGVACWIGVKMGLPTIGIAKDTLLQYSGVLGSEKGDSVDVLLDGEVVGKVLRSQKDINPIFVSVGHLFNLRTAVQVALHFVDKYRLPEPIRAADHQAREWAKAASKN